MDNKLVSIIVPVYNVKKYIEQCLDSICNQTYKNLQIIIVNDGSTDGVEPILSHYKLEDSRIEVLHKTNGGLSSARNAGLDIAEGEYVSFIDSDDIIPETYIEILVSEILQNGVDVVSCRINRFEESGTFLKSPLFPNITGLYSSETYIKRILSHKIDNSSCNKIFKHELIRDLRFIEGIINEDFPFMMRVLMRTKEIFYSNSTYYCYRISSGSITNSITPKVVDYIENASNMLTILPRKYHSDIKGYMCYESVTMICNIIFADKKKELNQLYNKFKKVINQNYIYFIFNKSCYPKQIIKYYLCILLPGLYRHLRKQK